MVRCDVLPLPLPERRSITVDVRVDAAGAETLAARILAEALGVDRTAQVLVRKASELPWQELSFLAVDVETTGFVAGVDRVIEVAWVRFVRGKEVERFSSLVDAGVAVPETV